MAFEKFASLTFGDVAPAKLVKPEDKKDIRDLMSLEAAGLIQGATGAGFRLTLNFDDNGVATLREGELYIVFLGAAESSLKVEAVALTPLGLELLSLLPGRDARAAARAVANGMRTGAIQDAWIGQAAGEQGSVKPIEALWVSSSTP